MERFILNKLLDWKHHKVNPQYIKAAVQTGRLLFCFHQNGPGPAMREPLKAFYKDCKARNILAV